MITDDVKRLENYGFDVEEKPTGYVFTMDKDDKNKEGNIIYTRKRVK